MKASDAGGEAVLLSLILAGGEDPANLAEAFVRRQAVG